MSSNIKLGRTKSWNTREFSRILMDNGYRYLRTHGDHHIYYNEQLNKKITINKNINKMVCRRLLKENNLIF